MPNTRSVEFQVLWVGCDGSFRENECSSLQEACSLAVSLSEHGAHTIVVIDDEGCDYAW